MKHDNFEELWAMALRQYDTGRELRMIATHSPHRKVYETGEIVITSNYYRDRDRGQRPGTETGDRDRGHFGNGVAILTPDEAPSCAFSTEPRYPLRG